MGDPVTTAVAARALTVLEEEAKSFLEAVIVNPARELGGLLTDQISARRHSNLISIVVSAKQKLSAAGVSPKEVPLKIVHPMLEAASLEEDLDLRRAWANLLSNAADPHQSNPVHPAFIPILKEFTSREVKFLDALYEALNRSFEDTNKRPLAANFQTGGFSEKQFLAICADAGLLRFPKLGHFATGRDWDEHGADMQADMSDFHQMIDNLKRSGILSEFRHPKPIKFESSIRKFGQYTSPEVDIEMETVYTVTQLGDSFMNACRAPRRRV